MNAVKLRWAFGAPLVLVAACSSRTQQAGKEFVQYSPSPALFVTSAVASDPSTCEPTTRPLDHAVFDVGLAAEYDVHLTVGNRLLDIPGYGAAGGLVDLTSASIVLTRTGDEGDARSFSVPASGSIASSANGVDAGFGLASFPLVPADVAADYARLLTRGGESSIDLVATVSLTGGSVDERSASSGTFTLPIHVCWGCTVTLPSAPDERASFCAQDLGDAPSASCGRGEDVTTDCRACRGVPACTPCSSDADCPQATLCLASGVCG